MIFRTLATASGVKVLFIVQNLNQQFVSDKKNITNEPI